jgi:hypothetical protein
MTDEEVYADLPDDPEEAFLKLEKHFKEDCQAKLAALAQDETPRLVYVEYISKVIAAVRELGIEAEFETDVPRISTVDYNTYAEFGKDVDHYRTKMSIRNARRTKGYSVRFDGATKEKIRHHLEQLRGIIEKLEVKQEKKESLFDKLNDFAKEVDRDRTRFEMWGAVVVQAAEVLGDAAEAAEPARKWVDSISRLIWGAKEKENETKQLPPPKEVKQIEQKKEPKRIEPPQKKIASPKTVDDEIPF